MIDARLVREAMDEISRLHAEYEKISRSWLHWTPWAIRKQYRLCKATEPHFALFGIHHAPMQLETRGDLFSRWVRR